MGELWGDFIFLVCKVEFACSKGEPDWLGWILMGFGVYLTAVIVFRIWLWKIERGFDKND